MNIVDAQIHLWGSGLPSNMAHRQVTSFTVDEVVPMMDEAGVAAAVIHPPPWDPGSTQMAIDAVRAHPGRFAIMAELPLDDPGSRARVKTWRDQPGMLGLRYVFLGERGRGLRDGTLDWLWHAAEEAGVPIAMLVTDWLEDVGRIAQRHPGLRLTVDHMGGRGGNTTLKDDAAMVHMPALLSLARYPNVAVKATGVPGYSAEAYPYPTMQGYVRQVFDAFGPHRTFWGTDISKMPVPWRQCIEVFTVHMPWLSADDLRLVMGDAVCEWWGWRRG